MIAVRPATIDDHVGICRIAGELSGLHARALPNRFCEVPDPLPAAEQAPAFGFRMYIVSVTTPFTRDDLAELRTDAPQVVRRRVPEFEATYALRGWKMFPEIGRVYVNERARTELGWRPRFDFAAIVERLNAGADMRSPPATVIGAKGYHAESFADGPYPVE